MIKAPEENFELHKFVAIPYSGHRYPGRVPVERFREGSNCQLFVSGVLDEVGFLLDHTMRSSELWADRDFTCFAGKDNAHFRRFDIVFFFPQGKKIFDLRYLHLGIYLGKVAGLTSRHYVLHNAKPGPSAVWSIEDFEKSSKRYRLYGAKRPIRLKT